MTLLPRQRAQGGGACSAPAHPVTFRGLLISLFFILLKKNSQCQEEQNVIEIAKDNNNEGGPPGT